MGLRIASQEGIPRKFIDYSCDIYEPRKINFPDSYALRHMSYEKFCATLLLSIKRPETNTLHDKRARWIAYQLHQLEMDFKNITVICSVLDWPWIKEAYNERKPYDKIISPLNNPKIFGVVKETLFFALAEFPYMQGQYGHTHAINYYADRNELILSSAPCWLKSLNAEDGTMAWQLGPELLCGTQAEMGNPLGAMGTFKSKGYMSGIQNHPPQIIDDIVVWPSFGASGRGGRSSLIGIDISNPASPTE